MARYCAKIFSLSRKRSIGVSFAHSCHSSGQSSNLTIEEFLPQKQPPVEEAARPYFRTKMLPITVASLKLVPLGDSM